MRKREFQGITYALAKREEFFSIILLALILATGTNLIASWLFINIPDTGSVSLWLGIVLILFPLLYVWFRQFFGRQASYELEVIIVIDSSKNRLARIPEYEFSKDLCRTLEAVFLENEALKNAWETEPLAKQHILDEKKNSDSYKGGITPSASSKEDISYFAVVKMESTKEQSRKKSEILLGEAIEFILIHKLSTHLSGYFKGFSDNDKIITEYQRQHVPNLLLDNRVLSLLTTPLEDRAIFLKSSFANNPPPGQLESIYGSDGSFYSRFNLTLPKNTKVSRPSPGKLVLENNKLVLELIIRYEGFSANLPFGFTESILGRSLEDLDPRLIKIEFTAKIKPQALLRGGGWNYHKWVDSFVEELREFASYKDFLDEIGWRIVATNLQAMSQIFFHQSETQKAKKDIKQVEKNID